MTGAQIATIHTMRARHRRQQQLPVLLLLFASRII
jgi:hypothetical protein